MHVGGPCGDAGARMPAIEGLQVREDLKGGHLARWRRGCALCPVLTGPGVKAVIHGLEEEE